MAKADINSFPLIDIVSLLEMDSGDAQSLGERTLEDILEYKQGHLDEFAMYKNWGPDWKQERPVYIDTEGMRPVLRNGHHRATHAYNIGLLFVHYTNDSNVGWRQENYDDPKD